METKLRFIYPLTEAQLDRQLRLAVMIYLDKQRLRERERKNK